MTELKFSRTTVNSRDQFEIRRAAFKEQQKKEFADKIRSESAKLEHDLTKAKVAYYPLGQNDLSTVMDICPNIEKIIITGADGTGPTDFIGDYTEGRICNLAFMSDQILSFNNARAFAEISFEFCDGQYPTLLLMAAYIYSHYGVEKFEVEETDCGHSLKFNLYGTPREVEYVDFHIETKDNVKDEDKEKRDYLCRINPDILINKAIPFSDGDFETHPSLLPILTGSSDEHTLVLSDQSFDGRRKNENVPTAIFKKGTEHKYVEGGKPSADYGHGVFGYGQGAFLTSGSAIIGIGDKSVKDVLDNPSAFTDAINEVVMRVNAITANREGGSYLMKADDIIKALNVSKQDHNDNKRTSLTSTSIIADLDELIQLSKFGSDAGKNKMLDEAIERMIVSETSPTFNAAVDIAMVRQGKRYTPELGVTVAGKVDARASNAGAELLGSPHTARASV